MESVYAVLENVVLWLFPEWLLAQPIGQIVVYGLIVVIISMVMVNLVMLPFMLFRHIVRGK